MRNKKISVCMACYNGEKYLKEQLESILKQLELNDEIVIIDDGSKDNTVNLVRAIKDNRIRLIQNEINLGVNKSFEKAICLARNDYIFMADQDDVWTEDRIDLMIKVFCTTSKQLVSGNSKPIGKDGEPICFELGTIKGSSSRNYKKNIKNIFLGKAAYYGCAMAFHKKLCRLILPFPHYIESHDLWIAMAANMIKSNEHLDEIVLLRRIHGANASVVNRSLAKKIKSRKILVQCFFEVLKRKKKLSYYK